MKKIQILLVDDHRILLDGIIALLNDDERFAIVAETTKSTDVMGIVRKLLPDIVVTDIQMPELSGIELTHLIKKEYPDIKVLALSISGDENDIIEMVEAGISGYILKNTGKEELIEALSKIALGGVYFSNEITAGLAKATRSRRENRDFEKDVKLTPREKEIIKLIVKEYRNHQIAGSLYISEQTVETHRKNIFRKTKTKSLVGLIKYALDHKIAE